MPVWQVLYDQLKDRGFEIISVSQDTDGEAVAGNIFDDAKVTYTALIDTTHKISSLYNFVNVPSAAWIDEEGKVVRINEGTYAAKYRGYGTDDYIIAVRDWVMEGADSRYVWNEKQVTKRIFSRSTEQEKADVSFKLGSYFHSQDLNSKADYYFKMAQRLSPDNINFLRQEKSFTKEGSAGPAFFEKLRDFRNSGKDFYTDLELEKTNE